MLHKLLKPGKAGQWIIAIIASFTCLTTGQVFSWPNAGLPKIMNGEAGFELDESELTAVVSVAYASNIFSPIPVGYVMDAFGRKHTILFAVVFLIMTWLLIYFIRVWYALMIARMIGGAWGGVVYTVLPAFIAEVVDPSIRGAVSCLLSIFLFLGALYQAMAGIGSYNLMTLVSIAPSIAVFIAFLFVPESPYFHLMKGNRESAKESLIWLTGECSDEKVDRLEKQIKEQLSKSGRFSDLIRTKAMRKTFLIVEVLAFLQRAVGISLMFSFLSLMLPSQGNLTIEECFIILYCCCIIASIASAFIMDRIGRRVVVIASCTGITLSMLGNTVWYYCRDILNFDMSSIKFLPLIFMVSCGVSYSGGMATVPQAVQGEMYPANIKSKGSALGTMTGSISSVLICSLFVPLNHMFGLYANFVVCIAAAVSAIVFSLTVMVETRGKTLDEIQKIIIKSRSPSPNVPVETS